MPLTGRYEPSTRDSVRQQAAVLASDGGSVTPPNWYYNVTKNPHVELQDGDTKKDYLARETEGAERATWWQRAVAVWPDFDRYTVGLARTIPLFVLSPIETQQ